MHDADDADTEYFVLPEAAFEHLPDELRAQCETMAEDGRAVLASIDNELNQIGRISRSYAAIALLRHVQERLAEYRFTPDMGSLLELDMLVTAFVVTYVRIQQGGAGSGFERNALPAALRAKHDEVVELRNRRFAHETDHGSVTGMIEIKFADGTYEIQPSLEFRVQIGGAPEWKDLVDAVEALLNVRSDKLMDRMAEKTGYGWAFAKKPD